MKSPLALVATTCLVLPAAALAQPVSGPYVAGAAGGSYLQDQSVSGGAVPAVRLAGVSGHLRTDVGPVGSLSLGYGFGNGLRIEVQGDYRQNKLYRAPSDHNSGGDQAQYGGFVNALYDFDLGPAAFGLSPYVGVGVGYEVSKFDNARTYGAFTNGAPFYDRRTGQDGGFAAQAILGAAYNIDAVPGLALTAEYRFTTIPEGLHYKSQIFVPGAIGAQTIRTDGTFNHAVLVGFRYAFDVAPPTPTGPFMPLASLPAPNTYLVFFDWGRADLNARARQIIAEAAARFRGGGTTRIEVNGYTDLSGTAAYNHKLSVRRAVSVEAELVRDGVPKTEIAIHGYGESNPLVPTAQGVREPQNRRVEIIFH